MPRAFAWDRVELGEAGSHLAVRVGESFLERSELLLECGKLRACGLELNVLTGGEAPRHGDHAHSKREPRPPLPDGAVGWCACRFCPSLIYSVDDLYCELCWPVECGCECWCLCVGHDEVTAPPESVRQQWKCELGKAIEQLQAEAHTPYDTRSYYKQGISYSLDDGEETTHATARGTHNPSMIGDMPNAHYGNGQGTAQPSPEHLAAVTHGSNHSCDGRRQKPCVSMPAWNPNGTRTTSTWPPTHASPPTEPCLRAYQR